MRTLAKVVSVIVAISALTVMAPGHAEEVQQQSFFNTVTTQAQSRLDTLVDAIMSPIVDISITSKDIVCLANNIYYEAGNEPEEGKVAVAMVTINRVRDGRFGNSICSVVNQRTQTVRSRVVTQTQMVQAGWFGRPEPQKQTTKVVENVSVCQFSWKCMFVRKPKDTDERWTESQRVATELLRGNYADWQAKYSTALYFHAAAIHPVWARQKHYVACIGGHHFYSESQKI
jgi:spore germination cell wall hydrolase CwlJ-like protein